jgi:hypothetical protein
LNSIFGNFSFGHLSFLSNSSNYQSSGVQLCLRRSGVGQLKSGWDLFLLSKEFNWNQLKNFYFFIGGRSKGWKSIKKGNAKNLLNEIVRRMLQITYYFKARLVRQDNKRFCSNLSCHWKIKCVCLSLVSLK